MIDFIAGHVWRIGGAIAAARSRRRTTSHDDPQSILLVQLDHLGDAVLTAAVLPSLRRRFPQARIEVLAAAWNCELFACCPEVDRLHVSGLNRFARGVPLGGLRAHFGGGLRARFGWIASTLWWGWRLRRERFDLAVDVRGEFPTALLVWLTGARCRLGWGCGGGGFLLTDRAGYVPGRHEVESRLALLAKVGAEPEPGIVHRLPWFNPGPDARQCVADRLAERLEVSRPLFVLHVGAGTQAKSWPADHWRELLGRIVVEHDAQAVLIGTIADHAWAEAMVRDPAQPGVHNWTGRLSLVETAALIERAALFVGADSGPAHLAAAVGTPAIVLFSGTNHAEQWHPWGRRVLKLRHEVACAPCHRQTCPWSEHPCMAGLSPEAVSRAIGELIGPTPYPRQVKEKIEADYDCSPLPTH